MEHKGLRKGYVGTPRPSGSAKFSGLRLKEPSIRRRTQGITQRNQLPGRILRRRKRTPPIGSHNCQRLPTPYPPNGQTSPFDRHHPVCLVKNCTMRTVHSNGMPNPWPAIPRKFAHKDFTLGESGFQQASPSLRRPSVSSLTNRRSPIYNPMANGHCSYRRTARAISRSRE